MATQSEERKASTASVPPNYGLASEDDAAALGKSIVRETENMYLIPYLAKLGYKQELRRNFTMIEVFGIAFSIMGLLPSIASTLAYSIPAGPVGMVWVSELRAIASCQFELTCTRDGS